MSQSYPLTKVDLYINEDPKIRYKQFLAGESLEMTGYEPVKNSKGIVFMSEVIHFCLPTGSSANFELDENGEYILSDSHARTIYRLIRNSEIWQRERNSRGYLYLPPLQNLHIGKSIAQAIVDGFDVRLGEKISANLMQQTDEWIQVEEHSHHGGKNIRYLL